MKKTIASLFKTPEFGNFKRLFQEGVSKVSEDSIRDLIFEAISLWRSISNLYIAMSSMLAVAKFVDLRCFFRRTAQSRTLRSNVPRSRGTSGFEPEDSHLFVPNFLE